MVNMSQSTNDVLSNGFTCGDLLLGRELIVAMAELRHAFEVKAEEFRDILKLAAPSCRMRVPMTLGQEFMTYVVMLHEDELRLHEAIALIHVKLIWVQQPLAPALTPICVIPKWRSTIFRGCQI